jgi:predicted ribosome quality control (RQC) complex YloA/Tae2 family protein
MVFYARHPITVTKDREDLDAALASPEPLFVATLRKHLAKDPIPGVTEIGGGDRVVVLANDAALAALRQRER